MANETALLELVNAVGEAKDRGEWDQNYWARETECGTTCCAAGTKALLDGQTFEMVENMNVASYLVSGESIEEYATEALELNPTEAHYLFRYYGNDYDVFVSRVKDVINGNTPEVIYQNSYS